MKLLVILSILLAVVIPRTGATCCCCGAQISSRCCTTRCYTPNCCQETCDKTSTSEPTSTSSSTYGPIIPTITIPTAAPPTSIHTSHSSKSNVGANISVTNVVNNHNVIRNPVHVHSSNVNNVVITNRQSSNTSSIISTTAPTTSGTHTTSTTSQPSTSTTSKPTTSGRICCVTPCWQNTCFQPRCEPTCDHQPYYYNIQPCHQHGCIRRQQWSRPVCSSHSCGYVQQDCSSCLTSSYYTSYAQYSQCYGCFY